MHKFNFRNYQPMNCIVRNNDGNELWLGDYGAATDLNLLKQKKIKHVLTAAAMLGIHYPKQAGINHKVINAFDIPTYKMTPHFQQAFQFISEGLKEGNVLVHCAAGISRSTTCVLVYLMRTKKMSFKQALEATRGKRPIVNPNYGFQNQLIKYETVLKKGNLKQQVIKKENKTGQQNSTIVEGKKTNNTAVEEKKAVMNFLNDEKSKVTNSRFNATIGGSKDTKLKQMEQSAIRGLRGKSMNYRQTMQNDKKSQNIYANQFLTYKLETPKIVTIKR